MRDIGRAMLSRRVLIAALPLLPVAIGAARGRAARAADAGGVQIYAAMTFRPALEHVLAAYRESGGAAVAVYGPTPVLVRQLAAGAPADLLLTADPMWMDDAASRKLIRPDTRSDLLSNSLVLAGAPDIVPVSEITNAFPLAALLGGGRLAMCDPANDPAGRYGKQSLQSLGLWNSVAARIAIAESVPAAVTMVDHGEVRAAICFRTDLHGDSHAALIGSFPAGSHTPIVYPIALATAATNPLAAAALAFLKTPAAMRMFQEFGYLTPG